MKNLYFIIICLLFNSSSIFGQYFTNPIYELADPHIVVYDGYYYATGTTGGNVVLKKSATLEGLKSSPSVEVFSPAKGGPCCDYWAPELHRLDGKWYIYYTANNVSNLSGQRTYVIENSNSDPLSQNWVNKGKIYDSSADYWAIDGTILSLNDKNYFVWSGVASPSDGDKPQRIYIAEMSNPYTLVPGRVLLSSPDQSWEGNGAVNEGPEVLIRNGKVFIVYSANGCWTPDYLLGMLSMDDTSDPLVAAAWTKHDGPVFSKKPELQVYGPGHHCFFTSPDGTEDWFAYHATTESGGACNYTRSVRAQRLYYFEDGTPDFREALPTGVRIKAPSGESELPQNIAVENGVYKIVARHSNKALDVAACSQLAGANVHQWDDNGLDCQRWVIQSTEDGYYTIVAVSGGLAMDVSNCSTSDGANVGLWLPNSADCQMWTIEENDEGYFHIISKRSGKALEIESSSTESGANLQQSTLVNATNQQFDLVYMGSYINPSEGYVSWESYNMRGKYVRHENGQGRMDSYMIDVSDSQWKMVAGLAGSGVSFQSKNYPANYLCNVDGELLFKESDGSEEFHQNATFIEVPGKANNELISFQSYLYPNRYIRHQNNLLYVETIASELDMKDATFDQIGERGVNTGVGKQIIEEKEKIGLYPNPAKDKITIKGLTGEGKQIQVRDIYGELKQSLFTNSQTIDLSALPAGIYFIQISTQKSKSVHKILKNI